MKELKNLGETSKNTAVYRRNAMLNQIAYAIGNMSDDKTEDPRLNGLFDTMIYSKSSD